MTQASHVSRVGSDLPPSLTDLIRDTDVDLAIEAAEPTQRGVDTVGPIGGCHDNHMGAALEAVHQGQQLRDNTTLHLALGLLTLGGDRVDLICRARGGLEEVILI